MNQVNLRTNTGQRENSDREAELWVSEAERFDAMNGAFGRAVLEAAQLHAGERVLDVGCGNGATTLEAAQQLSPGGEAVGVDIAAPMLKLARSRADAAGLSNVRFLEADAQTYTFEKGEFDAVISRFGVMFFEDPVVAFTNLGHALGSGGRLAIVCWQDVLQSEWTAVIGGAAAAHLGFPDFGAPGAPGPFSFADGERLEQTVRSAGFGNITIEAITKPMWMGDDAEDVITFFTSLEIVREWFGGKPQEKVDNAIDAVREALAPYVGPEGVVMSGTAWLLAARR
jgi:ubiquinone/menaquinone biosynthesis C-methylase UbiE